MSQSVVCEAPDCAEPLPAWQGTGRKPKFHSTACKKRTYRARKRVAEGQPAPQDRRGAVSVSNQPRKTPDDSVDGRASPRRGEGYQGFVDAGYPAEIDAGTMTQQQVARALNTSGANVSRWMAAWREDLLEAQERAVRAGKHASAEAQGFLEDFQAFRDHYFRTIGSKGESKRYHTAEFHRRWVGAVNEAIERPGGKTMVLSPPRHGKTELLNHFAIWLICRNPNIRIMIVGGTAEVAQFSLGQIADELEHNESLIDDFAGPTGKFKPTTGSGKTWSKDRFTIEGRTVSGIRSPTVAAMGRGGTLLSRDADIIIVDDVENDESVIQPHTREHTKHWFRTQVLSRRQPHTAVFVIGSRQHSDDLYASLLEDPSFHSIVETAHDEAVCDAPEDNRDVAHQHCVLFPEVIPYTYLMEQQSSMGRALFEMVYLNRPRPEGLAIFDMAEMRACLNPQRPIGDIPSGTRLVAGLDPAATGYQAAVLWAVDVESRVRYLVDLENEKGGGVQQAYNTISDWFTKYGCRHWVIEENNFQRAIRESDLIKDYASRNAITLEGHQTQGNKWDADMGVTSMAPLFEVDPTDERRHIDLPYSGTEAEGKVNQILRQWSNFTEATSGKRPAYKSDLVMAAWFPERAIRRWRWQYVADVQVDYLPGGGVQWMTNLDHVPWGTVGAA